MRDIREAAKQIAKAKQINAITNADTYVLVVFSLPFHSVAVLDLCYNAQCFWCLLFHLAIMSFFLWEVLCVPRYRTGNVRVYILDMCCLYSIYAGLVLGSGYTMQIAVELYQQNGYSIFGICLC